MGTQVLLFPVCCLLIQVLWFIQATVLGSTSTLLILIVSFDHLHSWDVAALVNFCFHR